MSDLMKSAAIITAPWLGWKILRELYVPKAFQWYAVSTYRTHLHKYDLLILYSFIFCRGLIHIAFLTGRPGARNL